MEFMFRVGPRKRGGREGEDENAVKANAAEPGCTRNGKSSESDEVEWESKGIVLDGDQMQRGRRGARALFPENFPLRTNGVGNDKIRLGDTRKLKLPLQQRK